MNRPGPLSRRRFIRSAAAAAAMTGFTPHLIAQVEHQLGAEDSAAPATVPAKETSFVRVLMHEADGSPLDRERVKTLHARDLANDPLPQTIITAEGRARIALAAEPMQISLRLKVPDFGEVYCYADNAGGGYAVPGTVNFAIDAAATRLRRVREAHEQGKPETAPLSNSFHEHLAAASAPVTDTAEAYRSLSHSLHAGELLALARARQRIARLAAPRKDFLFGAMVSGFDSSPKYNKAVEDLFNFATICWYSWKDENPPENRIDYSRMDASLNWCLMRRIVPKGFGYCYMVRGATTEWIRSWPYEKLLPEYQRVITQTCQRYHGRIPIVEVINEAHDKANLFHLNHEQILEMTRECCAAARRGSPTVKRQINNCCLWAEYAKSPNADGSRRWSPYRYIKDSIAAGTEFEILGLQLYYPQNDLFEIDRMLDRFADFNRPCHITEIATASQDGLDPTSMRPTTAAPGWHGPWSESTQADWLEAIYTLCYSKSHFQAIGWWDLADTPGHFWPHGGLLKSDLTPKQAYHRLSQLQKQWGVSRR